MQFQESDVIFSDDYVTTAGDRTRPLNSGISRNVSNNNNNKNSKNKKSSAPMAIPGSNNSSPSSSFRYDSGPEFEDDECFDLEVVPPHLIVDRRSTDGDKIAFSFNCSDQKNAMKRRNLIRVRNSVLRLTGFLES